ncbi:ATP-dependent DNA helicase pif1-like [Centruroides vittatus]|uniref:ATP-dependent DNA helicase pif1-like n=1 Tax=Centruroides vittatus TaxID=120091 RepID=UPI00350F16A5
MLRQKFADLLIQIGDGKLKEKEGYITIPKELCKLAGDLEALTKHIYPDLVNLRKKLISWLKERGILSPKNDRAQEINQFLLQKFDADEMAYSSIDSVVEKKETLNYPVEFLNTLKPSGIPFHKLTLKIGAPIMLLRNLYPPKLCNGTRLQVKTLHKNVVEATIITGCNVGESVFIQRIPLIPTDYPFQFKRLQFPVKLCFAMTINKAEGQTLKKAGIDLRENCFSHGQFYVACSRVSSAKDLAILSKEGKTTNIVYKEVLWN